MQYWDKLCKMDHNLSRDVQWHGRTVKTPYKVHSSPFETLQIQRFVIFRSVYKYKNLVLESVDLHKNMITKELNY